MKINSEYLIVVIILFLIGLCALAMIKITSNAPNVDGQSDNYAEYKIILDTETGCEYLATAAYRGGITPRLDTDGKQICRDLNDG